MKRLILCLTLLALPFSGCAKQKFVMRHTPDRSMFVFERPFKLPYNLELLKFVSSEMRKELKVPANAMHPEIVIKDYSEHEDIDSKTTLGIQYDILENGNVVKKVIEVYWTIVTDLSFSDTWTMATMKLVGVHEALHAYYDYVYPEEHRKLLAENKGVGPFDHCKMVETGDLEKFGNLIVIYVERYSDEKDAKEKAEAALRASLERAKRACEDGRWRQSDAKSDKARTNPKDNKRLNCLLESIKQ